MLDRFFHLSTDIEQSQTAGCSCGFFFFLHVQKQMRKQTDPSRERVELMPQRNPELQVWEQLTAPEKRAGHMQRRQGRSAHRSLQPHGQSHSTKTPAMSTAVATCKPELKTSCPLFSRQHKMGFANLKEVKTKGMSQSENREFTEFLWLCSWNLEGFIYSLSHAFFFASLSWCSRFQKGKCLLCTCGDDTVPCTQLLTG